MNTANYILKKYNIKTDVIEIPNAGRDDLAELLHELDFKVGVELGVADGFYSAIIMKANPQMKLYGVDPYLSYKHYIDYVRESTFKGMLDHANENLAPYMDRYEFVKEFSVDAVKRFEDNSLDFVYIDANHQYEYAKQDIELWTPKVRSGGIVAGHDYARIKPREGYDDEFQGSKNWGVIGAIQDYVKANDLQLFIWGLEAKIPNVKRDPSRSWMFCK